MVRVPAACCTRPQREAKRYGLASLDEARAYLRHPVLGARLVAATRLVLAVEGGSAHTIFGSPDDLKFRSSMTLFAHADPAEPCFRQGIGRYYGAIEDAATLRVMGSE